MSVTETERPEEFWVDALPKHVVDVMHGKDVEARFRDAITQDWTSVRKLKGWSKSGFDDVFYDGSSAWIFCQVYEPESWWLERPDPGPEYRLLGKLPDEPVAVGDEFFKGGEWCTTGRPAGDSQDRTGWYRRRIEPAPKFAVGQTVRVIGPKATDARHWSEKMNQHVGKESPIKAREKKDDGWFYEISCSVVWCFREDYLELVEPKTVRLDEGSKCPVQGCSGALEVRSVKDCSCHIRPPCAHCADNPPCCPVCEWASGDPIEAVEPEPKYKVDDRVRIIGPVPGCTLVGRIVRVKSRRLSVLDDGSIVWVYTVENTYEYVVREDYLAPAPPAPPSHPMCRCEIAPEQIKPVEGAAHYPKIGDTIFLPEMGRLKVLARGVEVC